MPNTSAMISEKRETAKDQRMPVNGFPITVIVLEPETISRGILAALLNCDGCRVFQADNPITAISRFRTNDPDVLLVDLDMPEWRAIVQHVLDGQPNACVIGMVESDQIPDASDLRQCGIAVCLQKSVLYNAPRRTLGEFIHGRHAG